MGFDKDILKRLRREKGLTQEQLAAAVKLSKSTISMYENGNREPDLNIIEDFAALFSVDVNTFSDRKTSSIPRRGVKIPVLGKVQAGIPTEAIENIIDYEEIPEEQARTGEFFGLQIKGDSMAPRILEGDVVIVRKQDTVDNGDTAIVLVNGNEATVKKFYKRDAGITLMPANPVYEPMFFSEQDVIDFPVVVIGKVVELRGKF